MVEIVLAVVAGVVTIAAPCILPLLPILLGASVGHKNTARPLYIIAGFVIVFSAAGLTISYLARHLGIDPNSIRTIAIVVLILFGAAMIWPTPFELLTARLNTLIARATVLGSGARSENMSGFILGMTLGLVWTPCAGPVLGTVLALIATRTEFATAGILLVAYAIGASVPMLLIAYGGQWVTNRVRFFTRYTAAIQRLFGIIVIVMAIALYFNYDLVIYQKLLQYYPALNPIL